MKVFISWSGELSRQLAEILRFWLPKVLQGVKPYFTPDDVEKGARWFSHISDELQNTKIGIFCLTQENLKSPWLMFEAGAISKIVNEAHYVCPILFGLKKVEVAAPLNQFQLTNFNKDDMRKLVFHINNKCGEQKLEDKVVHEVFEKWWPDLEDNIVPILTNHNNISSKKIREDRELLEEILLLLRASIKIDLFHNDLENSYKKNFWLKAYVLQDVMDEWKDNEYIKTAAGRMLSKFHGLNKTPKDDNSNRE